MSRRGQRFNRTRTDLLVRQESYTYYPNGNRKTFTDRKSQTTLSYDSQNRLRQAQFQDNSTIGYVYESSGRAQYINDSVSGQISRTYDNLDLLTSETTPLGTVSYVNDALGRLLAAIALQSLHASGRASGKTSRSENPGRVFRGCGC